jgi:virginiamycin B lyase
MTAGPDGNIWISLDIGGQLQRVTTAGVALPAFDLSSYGTEGLVGIAAGSDGNMWVAQTGSIAGNSGLIRVTPAGVATEFTAGFTPYYGPWGVAAGPDGAIWFTVSDSVGRIATH